MIVSRIGILPWQKWPISANNMKKTFFALVFLFVLVLFLYGTVAALVNQGHGLFNALLTFVLVGLGAGALVWFARPGK
ncbi:MAG TPA: hypothetical protein EYP90_08780 [Chromatiaceae bacterium]|nr:hypothetical protein [Chromatiaceae bacterium]